MSEFPWQQKTEPQPEYDPFMFVRLRIQHGNTLRSVGIRADDLDITGRIKLKDGTEIVVSAWGIPTKDEPLASSKDVMMQIIEYINTNGFAVA